MALFEMKWQAPEFEWREKSVSWYWSSIIFAVIILGLAVWQKNFLFGFFIVMAEILILAWANREPEMINFTLNEKGLAIGRDKFYSFAELGSWSIEDNDNVKWLEAFFKFKSKIKPHLKIHVPPEKADELKNLLQPVLQQVEHEPSMIDALERYIGF